jgi:Domain of unknown function (DUF1996)
LGREHSGSCPVGSGTFAVLYGCGGASSPVVERQEKQGGVEQAPEPTPEPPQSNDYDRDGIPNAEDPISGLEEHQNIAGTPRIKANCDVYATNRVDPIAFTQHLHHQIGTTTTNESTGVSLVAAGRGTTSCDMPWLTSAGWFPVEENEPVGSVNVYYRAHGDQRWVQDLPRGFQLLSQEQEYRCNTGSGEEPFQDSPPYGCTVGFGTHVTFPDCLDLRIPNDEANNAVESNNGVCPASHPYRIPKVNFLIMHPNSDGRITNPLRVSAGVYEWEDWTFMHGDYLAATQPQFNDRLVPLCLRNSREIVAHPDCGERN